jgi:hypothetical protein
MPLSWRPSRRWIISSAFSGIGIWIVLFLRATGSDVSINPMRNGSLYVFAFAFTCGSAGALLLSIDSKDGDAKPRKSRPAKPRKSRSGDVYFGATIIVVLALAKYLSIVLGPSGKGTFQDAKYGTFFTLIALVFGYFCDRWRSEIESGEKR